MLLKSFEVTNYKGFRLHQRLALAPLTLLYGENSSGKSALLRLLPWISESMADDRPGPVLDGPAGRDAMWNDLANIASPHQPVEVAVTWENGTQATWEIRGGVQFGTCELKSIRLKGARQNTWLIEDDGDGVGFEKVSGVSGLLPNERALTWLRNVGQTRKSFQLDVQWLQAIRAPIPRVEKGLASHPRRLTTTGEGVARILYQWDRRARSKQETAAFCFVQEFFKNLGFELKTTDVAPEFFRIDISPRGNPAAAVNLVDTGEGLTQVLAPLVALGRAAFGLGPVIVCLEQPELHLHTDAQRALAQSIAIAVAAGAQVLIETHSEVLLAATQLAVVAKPHVIKSSDVALYWVKRREDFTSVAHRVIFNEQGRIGGNWPVEAFDELLQLKTELLQAQRKSV